MSVIIKPVKNIKKISKIVAKEIKKLIKEKPILRIGIDWNTSTQSVLDIIKKNKKIDWYNTKIFSLSEYKVKQTYSLESDLYKNFVENINIYKNNFESMTDRIAKLDADNKINHLYDFDGGIDLMIFSIDSRGNFVFNDYESNPCLVNLANNGNDIYSPGIASILMAKKVICFIVEDATEKVLKTLNSKIIEKNDILTYLQLHLDCSVYTLTKLLSKKDVNKNISPQNYSEFRKEVAKIQDELKVDVDENNDEQKVNDSESQTLDGAVPENLDSNNYNKNNLDKELQETLENNDQDEDDVEEIEENLFSNQPEDESVVEENLEDQNVELENVEENQKPEEEDLQESNENLFTTAESLEDENKENVSEPIEEKELSDDESEKIASEFEKTLDENGHITDYKISEDEQIYVVENLENENEEAEEDNTDEIISVDDLLDENEISESLQLDSSVELDEAPEDLKLDLDSDSDIESLNPDDLDKELSTLDSANKEDESNEEVVEEIEEEPIIDNILNSDAQTNDEIPDNFKFKNDELDEPEIVEEKPNDIDYQKSILDPKPKSKAEQILKVIEIKTDALSSIEWLLLENRLGKLRNKLISNNLQEDIQAEEKKLIDDLPSYIKLIYVPGSRPVPLLMLNHTPDEFEYIRIYTEMVKKLKLSIPRKKFTFNDYHLWNIGAYFTYSKKTNEIDLLAFVDFHKFLYLLRHLNKPVYFYLKKDDYLTLKEDLDELKDEIQIVR